MEMAHDDSVSVRRRTRLVLQRMPRQRQGSFLEDEKSFKFELLLSGPFDNQPAHLILTAGAGGMEANNWMVDLKRMYERHAEKKGY